MQIKVDLNNRVYKAYLNSFTVSYFCEKKYYRVTISIERENGDLKRYTNYFGTAYWLNDTLVLDDPYIDEEI